MAFEFSIFGPANSSITLQLVIGLVDSLGHRIADVYWKCSFDTVRGRVALSVNSTNIAVPLFYEQCLPATVNKHSTSGNSFPFR